MARNQVLPYNVINTEILPPNQQIYNLNNLQITEFTKILLIHILSNLIMNINSILILKNYDHYNRNGLDILQLLMLFYFSKLFFNYCMLCYAKHNVDKIQHCLVCSYLFQCVLFCLLIYILTKIKNDNNSTILLLNNLLFTSIDIAFRIITEYKMNNRVNVIE